MKKSLVLTIILFSSMTLGSVVITPGTVQAIADVEEQSTENQKISKNIIYKTENQRIIETEKGETSIITGKLGDNVKYSNLIPPAGYDISDKNGELQLTDKSDQVIYVKPQYKKNFVVKFVDRDTNEELKKINIKGYVGSVLHISSDVLPTGYDFLDFYQEVIVSGRNNEETVLLRKDPRNNSDVQGNTIRFIGDNGEVVNQFFITGKENDVFHMEQANIGNDYAFDDDQNMEVFMKKDKSVITINVRKIVFTNKITFKDKNGKVINTFEYKGRKNSLININEVELNGYNGIPKSIRVVGMDNYEHIFKINGIRIKNIVQFYDSFNATGEIFKSFEYFGNVGDEVNVPLEKVPVGYSLNSQKTLVDSSGVSYVSLSKIVDYSLEFVDYKGIVIDKKYCKGLEGEMKDIIPPRGYILTSDKSRITIDSRVPHHIFFVVPNKQGAIPDKTNLTTNITFTDKDTKKQISKTQVSGKEGTSQKVTIPAGYKLANGSSNIVKMEKNTGSVTIQLVKVNGSITVTKPGSNNNHSGSHSSTSGRVESYSTSISTHLSGYTPLYNIQGKEVRNRALMANTNWHADKKMTLKGKVYYRVATSEWVSADNVYEYTSNKTVINTAKGSYKRLYNSKGKLNTNRALASNTSWATDKVAMINGVKMYRVATDEWVSAADIK